MACHLTSPSHYLSQFKAIISEILWSLEGRNVKDINIEDVSECLFKITVASPSGQWVKISAFWYSKSFLNWTVSSGKSLQWGQNERNGVSSQRRLDYLLKQLFKRRSKKHQSSASLAFVRGIHRWPADSPHKGPVTRKKYIWWRHHVCSVHYHHVILTNRQAEFSGCYAQSLIFILCFGSGRILADAGSRPIQCRHFSPANLQTTRWSQWEIQILHMICTLWIPQWTNVWTIDKSNDKSYDNVQ